MLPNEAPLARVGCTVTLCQAHPSGTMLRAPLGTALLERYEFTVICIGTACDSGLT